MGLWFPHDNLRMHKNIDLKHKALIGGVSRRNPIVCYSSGRLVTGSNGGTGFGIFVSVR